MKVLKKNRGFTLTELIIVIAIIGILAAVLIPTISGYIEKARLANDKADLRNMNNILTLRMIEEDVNEIDVHRAIEWLTVDNDFSLAPSAKKYTYWLDRSTNKIVLAKTNEILKENNGILTEDNFVRDEVGAVANNPKYVLIDQGNSALSKAVNGIRNLAKTCGSSSELIEAFQRLTESLDAEVKGLLQKYEPGNTLYICDWNMITASTTGSVSKIVFSLGTKVVPTNRTFVSSFLNEENVGIDIILPSTVRYVSQGALSNITSGNRIICGRRDIIYALGSTSESINSRNNIHESTLLDAGISKLNVTWEYPEYDDWEKADKITVNTSTGKVEYIAPVPKYELGENSKPELDDLIITIRSAYNHNLQTGLLFGNGEIIAAFENSGYITDIDFDIYYQSGKLVIRDPLKNVITGTILDWYNRAALKVFIITKAGSEIELTALEDFSYLYNFNYDGGNHPQEIIIKYNGTIIIKKTLTKTLTEEV